MEIILENTGRRYNADWIFRKLSHTFTAGSATAILGHNGSGKSTLLKLLAGGLAPSEGKIRFQCDGKEIAPDQDYRFVSFASPYLDIPPELNSEELFSLHSNFRPMLANPTDAISIAGLAHAGNKKIGSYSSGMRQRLKLALAFLTESKVMFIDEPHTNLDRQGMDWYRQMIEQYGKGRTLIVCSNHQPEEFDFCETVIEITDYKPQRRDNNSLRQRI